MTSDRISSVLVLTLAWASACQPSLPGNGDEAGSDTRGDGEESASETVDGDDNSTADSNTTSDGNDPSDGDTTEGDDPACDRQSNIECTKPAHDELYACLDACGDPALSCADEACPFDCWYQWYVAQWACEAPRCPEHPDEYTAECLYPCYGEALACLQAPDCSPRTCSFEAMLCLVDKGCSCEGITIDFPYEGSCELVLPGSTPPFKAQYTQLETIGMERSVGWGDETCADSYVGGLWADDNYDRIVLCDDMCEAFALEGSIQVGFLAPPCE